MSKPKVSVEVTQEQYDALTQEAKKTGKTVSDLVRDRLFPEATPAPAVAAVPTTAQPQRRRHACVFLRTVLPQNFKATECQGTCSSPKRRGQPCFWPSGQAHNCEAYEPFYR